MCWLRVGPVVTLLSVPFALVVGPAGAAWLCRLLTVCHVCA